ncbi:DJ-1/PfpI family protein [Sedimentibacter sp. zth1]|uniref:DJ-1/PfpI family protein n=1 Tax=Sedimentibacter sp. zth1 TaxID=2816908 RepID=UPI001A926EDC|nr:DJ-1/PfpI family protein [Sedimentibacter sp. zth1]QSX05720.1 DJ-1/PfpI family protein [Sedimentibacter sp. zth1]
MRKILCFIYNNMADFEITLSCDMLGCLEETKIISVAYERGTVGGLSQLKYTPDMTVREAIKLDDIDGLIIPGGFERNCKEELIELIQKVDRDKKLICAICAAPEYLAKAGILDNHLYTTTLDHSYFVENGIEDCFPRKNYLEEKVVIHENIITAKGKSFIDFGVEILDYFNAFDNADEKEMYARSYKGE